MRLASPKALLLGLGLSLAPQLSIMSSAEEAAVDIVYGRHSDFWNEIKALEHSDDFLTQLDRFFKDGYGSREGIATVNFEGASEAPSFSEPYFNRSTLGLGIHGLAGGEAYNRIAPRIRGYTVWDVALKGSLARAPEDFESGWIGKIGSQLGAGRQKLVQGDATDFFEKVPIRKSTIFYSAFDLGLGYQSNFSDYIQMRYLALARPSFFYSHFDDPEYRYAIRKNRNVYRWRTEYESTFFLQPKYEGGFEFGAQIFGGQQPIPLQILPRSWDAIHEIETFPEFGTLVGGGLVGRVFNASRKVKFELLGGFYGGYFGGAATFDLYLLKVQAGTFGLEQSSGYQLKKSRIEYVGLGLHHEW